MTRESTDLASAAELLTARLAELGWEVLPEEDKPDLKDFLCRHPRGLLGAFTVMSLVLMPGVLPDGGKELDIRLTFWADPARIRSDKHDFVRLAKERQCRLFRKFCSDLLRAAAIEPGRVWHRQVRHLPEGNVTILFDGHEPAPPAFEATVFQWGVVPKRGGRDGRGDRRGPASGTATGTAPCPPPEAFWSRRPGREGDPRCRRGGSRGR